MIGLTAKQAAYVEQRQLGKNCAEAARAAGYCEAHSRHAAEKIEAIPKIAEAVEAGRKLVADRTAYTVERLIAEIQEIIAEARAHKNPMSAIKGLELIGKLTGLLEERLRVQHEVGPDLIAARAGILADGRKMRDITPGKLGPPPLPIPPPTPTAAPAWGKYMAPAKAPAPTVKAIFE